MQIEISLPDRCVGGDCVICGITFSAGSFLGEPSRELIELCIDDHRLPVCSECFDELFESNEPVVREWDDEVLPMVDHVQAQIEHLRSYVEALEWLYASLRRGDEIPVRRTVA
jgi:hypothetical protein